MSDLEKSIESIVKPLCLNPIQVDKEYLKKWNWTSSNDFVVLARGDKPINENLYRVGGLNRPKLGVDDYFMLIKYTEAFYDKEIMRIAKQKNNRYLNGCWVIIDKFGVEKKEFKSFKSAYLISNSCLYTIGSYLYNIETDECYGSGKSLETADFIFLQGNSNSVIQINKKTGTKIIHY